VVSGVGVYLVHRPLRRLAWSVALPTFVRSESWYDLTMQGMLRVAGVQTRILQSGFLRRYLVIILLTAVGLGAWVLFSKPWWSWEAGLSEARFYEVMLAAVMIAATVMAVLAKSRLAAIVALGIVGYGMAMFFILFSAPDLAMTQFSIETLTVILFVLVVYRLPRFADYSKASARTRDFVLAVAAGAFMTAFVLAVLALPHWSHVSAYLVENSLTLAKGRNIVNVILVDFRGLDTLGEITVLGVAGIGAYALLKLKLKKEE
jgi:multicomponent Na+:H+ antiporter subunit A